MKIILTGVFILLTSQLFCQSKIVKIEGKIINRPIDTILLAPSGSDTRYIGIKIPIRSDSTFKFEFNAPYIEEYSLTFQDEQRNGIWKTIDFFTDSELIHFEIYPSQQSERNVILGGKLTDQKKEFYDVLKTEFGESSKEWFGKLYRSDKESDEWKIAKLKADSLNIAMLEFQHQYFMKEPSILGLNEYVQLLNSAKQRDLQIENFQPYQTFWLKKFPNHPLSEKAINLYTALSNLEIGSKFIEFQTLDEHKKRINFSDQFHDKKFIILDLWAPWCGPCIKKSKMLLENQKELNAKGLEVISIIGGISNEEEFVKALEKHKYPWKSYMEIKDENRIWEKYGIPNSGGSQYLFSKEGKLLAINPTKEELFSLLDQ